MDPLRLLVSGLSPGKWHVNSQGLSQGIDSKPTEAQDCAPTQAAEVDTVLGSQNLQRIAQVLRFHFAESSEELRRKLDSRFITSLNGILEELLYKGPVVENAINLIDDNAAVWEKRKEKIEKIVQLSYAQSSPSFATWDWTPHDAMVMFAPEIAAVIAHKSHSMLFAVGSKDWLLYAKGERQASVENFGRLHQALFQTLSRHLHEHPEEGDKYNNVAKVRYSTVTSAFTYHF